MSIRRPGLTVQILIALLLGALLGWIWPELGRSLNILATIFIRLVMVIIAPLIFSNLVVGIAGQGELRKLGGLAIRSFLYYMVVTASALALGFGLANILNPGMGVTAQSTTVAQLAPLPADSFFVRLFPTSILDAMARGDVLQIVVFSTLFALAVSLAGQAARPMLEWTRSLVEVMFKLTDLVMKTAPIGVFGAAASMVGQHGLRVGESFVRLLLAVYVGLAVLLLVLYPLLCVLSRIPLKNMFRAVKEPFAVAFATASSSAALPRAMETVENMGAARRVVAFVLSTALTFNLAGSTLFAGVASLFIVQAFNVPFTLRDQAALFGTLFLASKGIASVPRASLVVIAAGLTSVGVPPDIAGAGVGLILGIDPLMDMPRTAVNTAGNCVAAGLVAQWQGDLTLDADRIP